MTVPKRKLIEVALPLEAINRESAREKSIRYGHPSTLHLWWARRPLAACRAVLFAQLVDDPSSNPEEFPTDEAQSTERQRLFELLEKLVIWENTNDAALLREAHAEILKSTGGKPPVIIDPFAGGGSIPLEAQRLGLEVQASDLNPVSVLINKALIELPPQWRGMPPVFPGAAGQTLDWPGATGLAEDVRKYGQWMRLEAEKRIGAAYPNASLPDGTTAAVIAWLWARTVTCPNPACGIEMPLMRTWWLSKKRGQEAWVEPSMVRSDDGTRIVSFAVRTGSGHPSHTEVDGTMSRTGATCVSCKTVASMSHIRAEGSSGRMGARLVAIVAEGNRRRHYLSPSPEHASAADVPRPSDVPDAELAYDPRNLWTPAYGLRKFSDLFTNRQLLALTTFSDLVTEARAKVLADCEWGMPSRGREESLSDPAVFAAYADAVSLYLAFAIDKGANLWSSSTSWMSDRGAFRETFARQAIPMAWDYAEANVLGETGGGFLTGLDKVCMAIANSPLAGAGQASQADAATRSYAGMLVATDPPYYDNIGYANLSDFFYGWLRRSLGSTYPDLLATLQTPKADELVADPYRHGGKAEAAAFFESGFNHVFSRIRQAALPDLPITVFYAFRQAESDDSGTASTGWQTLLEGMLNSGWEVSATWPMRTESPGRIIGKGTNALASSIVLALRPRPESAEALNRRGFIAALKSELPRALRELQQGSIAPVDLAQAAIGPGMAVFSRCSRVVEADGSNMSVRTALALINQVLDEVLSEQEGDFDSETRFCVKWFTQFGWTEGAAGQADVLSRALNTSVAVLERGGVFRASAGKARLIEPAEMSGGWDPAVDKAISVWEVSLRVAHALQTDGTERAGAWMAESSTRVDLDAVKELSYLLYSICEKKGWSEAALLFNGLGTSWSDLQSAARAPRAVASRQGTFDLDSEDDE